MPRRVGFGNRLSARSLAFIQEILIITSLLFSNISWFEIEII
jgi:hypothetical protein